MLVGAGEGRSTSGWGGQEGISFDADFGGVEGFCWGCEGSAECVVCGDGCPAEEPRAGPGDISGEHPSFAVSVGGGEGKTRSEDTLSF